MIKSRNLVAILLLLFLVSCGGIRSQNINNDNFVGIAKLLNDGTIVLSLKSETIVNGEKYIAHNQFTYKKNDPQYEYIKNHVGHIEIGQEKSILPFPD